MAPSTACLLYTSIVFQSLEMIGRRDSVPVRHTEINRLYQRPDDKQQEQKQRRQIERNVGKFSLYVIWISQFLCVHHWSPFSCSVIAFCDSFSCIHSISWSLFTWNGAIFYLSCNFFIFLAVWRHFPVVFILFFLFSFLFCVLSLEFDKNQSHFQK